MKRGGRHEVQVRLLPRMKTTIDTDGYFVNVQRSFVFFGGGGDGGKK